MVDDYENLKSDQEGLYSLSHKLDADLLSKILKDKFNDIKIMDGTASIGGNSISFGKHFSNVISVEINEIRFSMLLENLKNNSLNNLTYCGDFMNFLDLDFNLIFLDPPWGGPNYKLKKILTLEMDNISLKEITKTLKSKGKIVVLKLPYNYDMNDFKEFNYEKIQIKNYFIVIIY